MYQKWKKAAKESLNPEYSKALQAILSKNIGNITNESLKATIQQILQGINQLDTTQNLDVNTTQNQNATVGPSAVNQSSNVNVLGASNKVNVSGLDGIDDMVFDKDTVRNKSNSVQVRLGPEGSISADIALQRGDEKTVGHAKAFGTLNNMDLVKELNPFMSILIQIANVQPLFFISSVLSQMLVQMGRLSRKPIFSKWR